jgi:hypothetical protein
LTLIVRRLSEPDFAAARDAVLARGRFAQQDGHIERVLLAHLAYIARDAIRASARPLPAALEEPDDPVAIIYQWLDEKGQFEGHHGANTGPLTMAFRQTATPGAFYSYVRTSLSRWFIDLRRREREPQLYMRTLQLLTKANGDYHGFHQDGPRKAEWWFGWKKWLPSRGRYSGDEHTLAPDARVFLKDVKRPRENPRKPSGPIILRNKDLASFVAYVMDAADDLLQPGLYGRLYKLLFPDAYRRYSTDSIQEAETRARERGETLPELEAEGEDFVGVVGRNIVHSKLLEMLRDADRFEAIQELRAAGWDVAAAARRSTRPKYILDSHLREVRELLRIQGADERDLEELFELLEAEAPVQGTEPAVSVDAR